MRSGGYGSVMEPVDPLSVPTRTLWSGAAMPAIGVGTFGSDHVDHATVARSVGTALALGYCSRL